MLRCINFRRVSDPRRAFRLALRVTRISNDYYRSTMGVIVIGLGTPQSAGVNFGCTCEHLEAQAISLGVPTISLGAPGSTSVKCGCASDKTGCTGDKSGCADDRPPSAEDKSGSTSNHSRAVWEKQHLLWGRCWCTWKSYLLHIDQRLLKLMYSVSILIYVSI